MRVILVVDDAPVIRRVAKRIIEDLGFKCIEAENGISALHSVKNFIPDAMIVDWDLVDMTGLEFINEFRKLKDSDRTKVFYCTSQIVVSEMTKAKRAGASEFLLKPFDREILTKKIQDSGLLNIEDTQVSSLVG